MKKQKTIVFINPISRCIHNKGSVNEGGIARFSAWDRKMKNREDVINIDLDGKYRFLRLIYIILFTWRKTILLLYPNAGIRLDRKGKKYEFIKSVYISILKLSSLYNRIIFDVSDLKYEQAIDLELDYLDPESLKKSEKKLFSWKKFRFIFASFSMKEYAVQKYGIIESHAYACINGGEEIAEEKTEIPKDKDEIVFIYAGTLNKGRSIETMIREFPEDRRYRLKILGTDGEWINDIIKEKDNIEYLGPMKEEEAHRFVSQCDIGMIPYDDSRLYYNIAYPTKLSFYITAGIPYLSTPTKEIMRIQEQKLGYAVKLDEWKQFILQLDREQIKEKRYEIESRKKAFTWETALTCNWIDE